MRVASALFYFYRRAGWPSAFSQGSVTLNMCVLSVKSVTGAAKVPPRQPGDEFYASGEQEKVILLVKQALVIYEAIESPYAQKARNKLKKWGAED
jgi:hypothetical protein